STVFIGPAALALRLAIRSGKAAVLATVMLVLILPTHLLLAGQYAIDFTVPLMVQIGGDALTLHGMLAQSVLVNTLFYALPNLVFLCLMILSVAVIASARLAKVPALILALNWLCVLLGNLIDPAFQRTAIVLLSLSFLPLVIDLWKEQG
ncbi:MAG: hypothetical protein KDD94_11220, partial [Calditrichaeota bacterium]|nr:hypothetical protein [Calditrichota bacterium]